MKSRVRDRIDLWLSRCFWYELLAVRCREVTFGRFCFDREELLRCVDRFFRFAELEVLISQVVRSRIPKVGTGESWHTKQDKLTYVILIEF